ncbi:phage baseplate protein [Paenibacillus sp. FSL H8-0034]|uniref:phage baseplate protein n=1 Tax=Paenibacillus sp. FSL H8-0034 TaxID=2954671 RepID=UPI0030F62D26
MEHSCVRTEQSMVTEVSRKQRFIGKRLLQVLSIFLAVMMLSISLLTIGEGIAQASVPNKFDLSDAAEPLFTSKALTDNTVQQSFAFDNTNNCIYVVQVTAGGQQLGTETRTYTAAERALNGDLTVTKLSTTGTVLGKMYLMGFGHGLSIGAEPVGTTTYLWTDVDAFQDDSTDANSYGTQLARFAFVNNQVLVHTDSSITKYSPVAGADRTTVNVDMANGLLTVRYRTGVVGSRSFHYSVYDLAKFKTGTFTPLATVDQPSTLGSFKGFVSYGSYLYVLDGNAYNSSTNPTGNTYITTVDFNSGAQVDRSLTNAGSSLLFREPHGMSIQTAGTDVRLSFGFASYKSSTDTGKNSNIFYKDAFVSKMFDLSDPAEPLLTGKALTDPTLQQGFAIDNTNNHIYMVQVTNAGQQLGTETRTYSSAERALKGDLTVTKLSSTGTILGKMYLIGFGHGVSIGVEPVGTTAYLWTEVDAVNDGSDGNGYGTQLARFPFVNNQVLVNTDSSITKYAPVVGADRTTVNIDMTNGLLTMRYRTGVVGSRAFHYSTFNLAQLKGGTFTPLATVDQPTGLGTFQGFASYGSYLYLLDGTAYDATTNPTGNTYITTVNLNTGLQVDRQLTNAGSSLLFREPEGMSIQVVGTTVRLCFGFGSYRSSTDTKKNANIFYKDALVTGT